jgi:hypothetical protein
MKNKTFTKLMIVFYLFIVLIILKPINALSIGISPSSFNFTNNDNYKEIILFNPNKEGIFVSSESKNYRILPGEFFVESENEKRIKLYLKNCVDENITLFLKSDSNVFPALRLSVTCNKETFSSTKDQDNNKIFFKNENYDKISEEQELAKEEETKDKTPDKRIGFLVSFSIVFTGLIAYFSINKKEFKKIKKILEKFFEIEDY